MVLELRKYINSSNGQTKVVVKMDFNEVCTSC